MRELGEQCVIGFGDGMSKPTSIDISDFKIFVETPPPNPFEFYLWISASVSPIIGSLTH